MSRERGGGGGGRSGGSNPVSLLVRNLSYRSGAYELKDQFGRFGDIRDVYIPLEYHSKQPRGFAFIEYYDPADAKAAQRAMDNYHLDGRDITVVFAQERRKNPDEMRTRGPAPRSPPRGGGRYDDGHGYGGRSSSRRDRSYSPPPRRRASRSPPRRASRRSRSASYSRSRSRSPPPKRASRRDASGSRSRSPPRRARSPSDERDAKRRDSDDRGGKDTKPADDDDVEAEDTHKDDDKMAVDIKAEADEVPAADD